VRNEKSEQLNKHSAGRQFGVSKTHQRKARNRSRQFSLREKPDDIE